MSERVPEERVLEHWLGTETGDPIDPETLPEPAVRDALLSRKPGAAAFVWRERPIRWYRLELDREAFAALRPVGGPDDLLWRDLSTDGTLVGVARRLLDGDRASVAREAGVDPEAIDACRETVAAGRELPAIVVRTRRGRTPWYVADGNHRVVGRALHMLETGEYVPQSAYVAVTANPVLGPLRDRALGLLDRLRGRSPARGP